MSGGVTDIVEVIEGDGERCPGCDEPLPGGGWCERCERALRMLDRAIPGASWSMELSEE